jgi:hypothetical protein
MGSEHCVSPHSDEPTTPHWLGLKAGLALVLMTLSAICFLKDAWYAACISGWYGLPSYAQEFRTAQIRASLYFSGLITFQAAACAVVWSSIRLRYTDLSQFLRYGARLGVSAAITLAGAALLAWILSWMRYFHIR